MKLEEFLNEANLVDTYIKTSKKDISDIKDDLRKLEKSLSSKDVIGALSAAKMIKSIANDIAIRMERIKNEV